MAALIGAVGFELLKLLLSGYMQGVAAKSMYGAFGVPVALLLWINFTAKLLLFCAAWTATPSKEPTVGETEARGGRGAADATSPADRGRRRRRRHAPVLPAAAEHRRTGQRRSASDTAGA